SPTVVFLQQPDDGVVWWDPRTAVERPDWLREPRAPEVNPAMEWRPVVTFLNLTVDMVVSNDFAEGAGHRYGTLPTDAWNAILAPGWERDDLRLLRDDLARIQRELPWCRPWAAAGGGSPAATVGAWPTPPGRSIDPALR